MIVKFKLLFQFRLQSLNLSQEKNVSAVFQFQSNLENFQYIFKNSHSTIPPAPTTPPPHTI